MKTVKIEGIGYVSKEKQRIPDKDSYSSIELLKYFQYKGVKVSKSSQWTNILKEAEKNGYKEMVEDMLTGDVEVQATIIAFPDKKGSYASNIKPKIKKGKSVFALEEFEIKGDVENYTLEGGQRKSLPNFPKSSGNLKRAIPELGLPKGAYVYIDSDFDYGEGLRAVFRSCWFWVRGERRFGTYFGWGLSERDSRLASRPIFEEAEAAEFDIREIDEKEYMELKTKARKYDKIVDKFKELGFKPIA